MQELWDLSGRSVLLIALCGALFGATASYAIASYGRLPKVLAILVGVLFPGLGIAVLGVVVLARRTGGGAPRQSDAPPPARREPVDSGYQGFDSWDTPAALSAESPGAPSGDSWGFDAYDSVEPASAVTPAADLARGPRRGLGERLSAAWVRTDSGRATAVVSGLAIVLVVVSVFVGWLSINAAIIPRFWFYPFGTGLDISLLVTAVVAGCCAASLATRPFRSVAVLLAWVADTWLVLCLLLISSRYAVARFLEEIGALTLSVGDVLQSLGLDTRGGVVELPPGVDLSSLGVPGRTVDMSSMELGAVIPDVSIDIGPGVYLMIAFAILANAAVFIVLRAADHNRSAAQTSGGMQ